MAEGGPGTTNLGCRREGKVERERGDTCRLPLLFNTCSLMTLSNFIASYRESHGHPAVHPSECVENMCVAGKKHNINCVCCVHSFQLHVCFFLIVERILCAYR